MPHNWDIFDRRTDKGCNTIIDNSYTYRFDGELFYFNEASLTSRSLNYSFNIIFVYHHTMYMRFIKGFYRRTTAHNPQIVPWIQITGPLKDQTSLACIKMPMLLCNHVKSLDWIQYLCMYFNICQLAKWHLLICCCSFSKFIISMLFNYICFN